MANTESIPKYEIRVNGEYATLCVERKQAERDGQTYYGGHLLINSSFGAFAHYWSNCGDTCCLEDPGSFITVKPDPQLVQFWQELWPEFLKKLN